MNRATILLVAVALSCFALPAVSQSFIDFEFVPGGLPSEGLPISTEFQASLGIAFIMEDGSFPTLSEVGPPRTAFNGFGGPDQPAPGNDVGRFFLTDDGMLGGAPPALLINYTTPVTAASGDIIDIDFSEEWNVEARDAMGNVLASQLLQSGNGNGASTNFSFSFPTAVISQVRIEYTGGGSQIGLAFDNFLTVHPGDGTGQANSAEARLEINRQGASGAGPFDVQLFAGGTLEIDWSGPALFPVALMAGPTNGGALPLPCFGSIDVGTPPFFSDLVVLFDGTLFPQSLFFTLDAAGHLSQTTSLPASASGVNIGFQGFVFQPAGSPCGLVFTAAFDLSIL